MKLVAVMRLPGPVRCFLVLLGLLCVIPITFAEELGPRAVPFQLVRGFAIVIPVTVNGHGPYDFMLDTGTTVTAVDRELSEELALEPHAHSMVNTLTQHLAASIALARRVSFGPVTEQNVAVMIRDLSGFRRMVPNARGVLGQNALNHADFLLDYQHKRLEFDVDGDLVRLIEGHYLPLRRYSAPGNPYSANLVKGSIANDGVHDRDKEFLLDSGARSPVIFGTLNDTAGGYTEAFVADTEGRQVLAGVREIQLVIDGKSRKLLTTVLTSNGKQEIGGLLPTDIFSRIYISNTGGFVVLEPKVKKSRSTDRLITVLPPQSVGGTGSSGIYSLTLDQK
jgi:predicted aspartyl protease